MKIALFAVAIYLSACGLPVIGDEPAIEPPVNWLGIFARDKATLLTLHESCQKGLDELVPRIKRDTEIACGSDPVAADAARERIKKDRRQALKLNFVLEEVMRAAPLLPRPRYYTDPRQSSPITEEKIKALA